ncbi:MAG: phenylalanine--tRNA ligase subunit beta [Prevotella sp.]|jgi:phenylalanyl-tRNA synthetase beta chain|nr:phenylalanine--tRNA ligase subunit beta [Prevotella sp.]MCH4185896.1 phenylalanine--tRNA ligase subunit beta [Prevotella sp.]MCH4215675.1 phenylalanine--tRNA ligase subunit beta [Prevotella sp.]MCH4251051.1 phenylalanine--tRNA ligase subunit beta [Prevotella sp.]MCI1291104.1 phenylalanine--tRNA ligase subunit beta [Prevotella sp.]MCI1371438.1 phenylalanine--tRNA ligase subunit beta [Prevotella sp.]
MNISYKWLKEYVDFDLTPQETADALTSTGLEVDALTEVQTVKGGLKGLYVGKVLTCEPHPNSDHLHITTVDLGKGTPSQIICGAPNVAAGEKVIVADVGCELYDGDQKVIIKKAKLRGVESCGMICAEDEIGIGTDHSGIIVLPDEAVVGIPAAEYYHLESDWVIEIDITANRGDALSHYGVARDLYAWLKQNGYQTRLHRPDCDAFRVDNHDLPIEVEIQNTEACKRYACVSITDCDVKESPKWLQDKLRVIGLRPINNIVDITNYIMMAYGQPMHCFDADMVKGHKIVVRTQPEGTKFVTLDGVEHTLGAHDLSICNAEEPMCIAGIFGGKGSGTYETTRNVVLESAYFHPTWIRKSARRHGLGTDASYRFERGIDPNGIIYALKQAAILCCQLAGGKVSMSIKDVYPEPIGDFDVRLNYEYCDRLIGKQLDRATIKNIVTSLEMKIKGEDSEGLDLSVPPYRVDVQRPCDVVEDILRIYGYNNVEIPLTLKSSLNIQGEEDQKADLENHVSELLVGCGFFEIMNNSLTKTAYYQGTQLNRYPWDATVKVMNPLSSDLGVMRQTLLFGGLESIVRNVHRKNPNLKFFEVGNCYRFLAEKRTPEHPINAYKQSHHLGLWVTGKRVEGSWAHPDEDSSFFELKAYVENILRVCGLKYHTVVVKTSDNNIFSKGLRYETHQGDLLAEAGIVDLKIKKAFELNQDVFFADIDLTDLARTIRKIKFEFKEVSKFPAVSRDLALLIDKNVEFSQIEQIARKTEKKLLKRVELFDVYEGKNLPSGKKSYAINFILQDDAKTLDDKAIDTVMKKLIHQLTTQLHAELR